VRELGELREIKGADWNLEMGAITELAYKGQTDRPAILFDEIKDYPKGYRVAGQSDQFSQKTGLDPGHARGYQPERLHPPVEGQSQRASSPLRPGL